MISCGLAHYNRDFDADVAFAKQLGFEFFQIWFHNGKLTADTNSAPSDVHIKNTGFPIIIHAVFDMPDYKRHGAELLRLLQYFGHNEVIIHPICETEAIDDSTIHKMAAHLQNMHKQLQKFGIKLYVENNSVIDGIFNTSYDLRVVFDANPDIGLLLDLAHINDYDHLRDIVKMRRPECIHIADKRFGVPHEHLPLGDGELDFIMIFREIIPNYSGRLILEAVETHEGIIKSKKILNDIIREV